MQITPTPKGDSWQVTVIELYGERVELEKYIPHPLGMFSYPRSWKASKAKAMLKRVMIKAHEKEIKRLQKSIEALRKL